MLSTSDNEPSNRNSFLGIRCDAVRGTTNLARLLDATLITNSKALRSVLDIYSQKQLDTGKV